MPVLEKEFERLIDLKVQEQLEELKVNNFMLKPFFKIDTIARELDGKSARWVRDTFCSGDTGDELINRKLIKKIGNKWHFRNPEFLSFVHNEWWETAEGGK